MALTLGVSATQESSAVKSSISTARHATLPVSSSCFNQGIEVFFAGLENNHYSCWMPKDLHLPMIYIDECIGNSVKLIKADKANLTRTSYNLGGLSFTPGEFIPEVQKLLPDMTVAYEPVEWRQRIAESWPRSFDNSISFQDWGCKYDPTLEELARTILTNIDDKYKAGKNVRM